MNNAGHAYVIRARHGGLNVYRTVGSYSYWILKLRETAALDVVRPGSFYVY